MTTEILQGNIRVRVNVETSTKGQHTYSATIETNGQATLQERADAITNAIADSDLLVSKMDERYPAPKDNGKPEKGT